MPDLVTEEKPVFDPTAPFEAAENKPAFDPTQAFEPADVSQPGLQDKAKIANDALDAARTNAGNVPLDKSQVRDVLSGLDVDTRQAYFDHKLASGSENSHDDWDFSEGVSTDIVKSALSTMSQSVIGGVKGAVRYFEGGLPTDEELDTKYKGQLGIEAVKTVRDKVKGFGDFLNTWREEVPKGLGVEEGTVPTQVGEFAGGLAPYFVALPAAVVAHVGGSYGDTYDSSGGNKLQAAGSAALAGVTDLAFMELAKYTSGIGKNVENPVARWAARLSAGTAGNVSFQQLTKAGAAFINAAPGERYSDFKTALSEVTPKDVGIQLAFAALATKHAETARAAGKVKIEAEADAAKLAATGSPETAKAAVEAAEKLTEQLAVAPPEPGTPAAQVNELLAHTGTVDAINKSQMSDAKKAAAIAALGEAPKQTAPPVEAAAPVAPLEAARREEQVARDSGDPERIASAVSRRQDVEAQRGVEQQAVLKEADSAAQALEVAQQSGEPERIASATARNEAAQAAIVTTKVGQPRPKDVPSKIAGPVLIDAEGKVIAQGKIGQTHKDLMEQGLAGENADAILEAFSNDAQHAFVDEAGTVLNRKSAAVLAVESGQAPAGTENLHSQMLKNPTTESPATLNVGLNVGDVETHTPKSVVEAIEKIPGVKVTKESVHRSDTEKTSVVTLNRSLTKEELHQLSETLKQDAIAQNTVEGGMLEGPRKENFGGEFNGEYFLDHEGKPLSEPARVVKSESEKLDTERTQLETEMRTAKEAAVANPNADAQRVYETAFKRLREFDAARENTTAAESRSAETAGAEADQRLVTELEATPGRNEKIPFEIDRETKAAVGIDSANPDRVFVNPDIFAREIDHIVNDRGYSREQAVQWMLNHEYAHIGHLLSADPAAIIARGKDLQTSKAGRDLARRYLPLKPTEAEIDAWLGADLTGKELTRAQYRIGAERVADIATMLKDGRASGDYKMARDPGIRADMQDFLRRQIRRLQAVWEITKDSKLRKEITDLYGELKKIRETPSSSEVTDFGGLEAPRVTKKEIVEADKWRISQRVPTNKNATENALTGNLKTGLDSVLSDSKFAGKMAKLVGEYEGFKPTSKEPKVVLEEFVSHAKENLLWLYDNTLPEIRERARHWYVGANKIAGELGEKFGEKRETVSAVIASLSPQNPWHNNVSLAERVMDVHKNQRNSAWGDAMTQRVKDMVKTSEGMAANKEFLKVAKRLRGKKYGELTDIYERAVFVRIFDEAHNPRQFDIITPEGGRGGPMTNAKGALTDSNWFSFNPIQKALSVLDNPARENISLQMGFANKVRNFYNSIVAPHSLEGDYVSDTHNVAASLLEPVGGKERKVKESFGGMKNGATGDRGTYALYAEAGRRAAAERDVLPREMQSVTWEAVRSLFSPEFKTDVNLAKVRKVWENHKSGKLSIDEARNQISKLSGGFDRPEWSNERDAGLHGKAQAANDAGNLPESGISRGGTEPAASRTGRVDAGTVSDGVELNAPLTAYGARLRRERYARLKARNEAAANWNPFKGIPAELRGVPKEVAAEVEAAPVPALKKQQLTHAEQDVRDTAYMADLRDVAADTGLNIQERAAELRRVHVAAFPEMKPMYETLGYSTEGKTAADKIAGDRADISQPAQRELHLGAPKATVEEGLTVADIDALPISEAMKVKMKSNLPKTASAEPVRPAVQPDAPAASMTSTKLETVAAERAARDIAPVREEATREFGEAWAKSEEMIKQTPDAGQRLVSDLLTDKRRALNDIENATLLHHQIEVQNKHQAALDAFNTNPGDVAAKRQLEDARVASIEAYDAADIAGTETGRGLNARKMLAAQDFSPTRMETVYRAEVNDGKALTKEQADKVAGMNKRITKAKEAIEQYEVGQSKPLSVEQLRKASPKKLERLSNIQLTATLKSLDAQIEAFAPRERTVITPKEKLSAPTATDPLAELIGLRDKLATIEARRDARALEGDKKRIRGRIEDVRRRIAEKDFSPTTKRPLRMDAEKTDLLFEYQKAKDEFNAALIDDRIAFESKAETTVRRLKEAGNLARAAKTSFDLSAVLRQGGFIGLAHPVRAARNIGEMFRAMKSEKEQFRINEELSRRENAPAYKQAGLFLAIDKAGASLAKAEEAFASRWAKKIPGIAGSERAYTTFLNLLRADSFDAMARGLARNGKPTLAEMKGIANYINVATGRGDVGKLASAAAGLNHVFFAPRYVVSRFQLLTLQPLRKGALKGEVSSNRVRAQIATEYARSLSGLAIMIGLGVAAGAQVETDPRSSDFLKLRFGNTRLDPLMGLGQTAVLLSRLATHKTKSGGSDLLKDVDSGKFGATTSGDLLLRFGRSKLAPIPSAIWNAQEGKDVTGTPTNAGWEAAQLYLPLSLSDVYKTMREQGLPRGTAMTMLSLFGMGLQTYSPRPKKSKSSGRGDFSR